MSCGDFYDYEPVTGIFHRMWSPIATAPRDGTLMLVWAPGVEGLPPMFYLCAYHPDAGFCIDELREPTHWMSLPEAPE